MILPMQIENKVLQVKAKIFAEELEGWSLEAISRAFHQLRRKSRFFPALVDVLDECREAKRAIDRERNEALSRLPAPDDVPPDKRQANVARLMDIKARLDRRLGGA
jgi:hypothetical protein